MNHLNHAITFWKARLAEASTILTLISGAIPAAVGVPSPYCWIILLAAAMQAMVPAAKQP
jgi:hypothetical protein